MILVLPVVVVLFVGADESRVFSIVSLLGCESAPCCPVNAVVMVSVGLAVAARAESCSLGLSCDGPTDL